MSMKRILKNWTEYAGRWDADDVLELIGLERRRGVLGNALPLVGMLLVGAVMGAGLGLLFAPRPGRLLRREAERKVDEIKDRIRSTTVSNTPSQSGV